MKRPNINKYPIIVNGKHQYYQDDINKYIDYLEAENKQLRIGSVTPRYFYVVEKNYEENLDQLSVGLETLARAKTFKDSDYHKKKNPNAFIVCTFNEG